MACWKMFFRLVAETRNINMGTTYKQTCWHLVISVCGVTLWDEACSGRRGPDWWNYDTHSKKISKQPLVFDVVDQMVLSAPGSPVLARRPSFGPAHTWSGLHTSYFLPRCSHSCYIAAVCFTPHPKQNKQTTWQWWLFPCWGEERRVVGRRGRTFHISVYQAICVWLCKCARPDPSNSVDIWSPALLSSVALCFTTAQHLMICERRHWNSTHTRTQTHLWKWEDFFFTHHCKKWEGEKLHFPVAAQLNRKCCGCSIHIYFAASRFAVAFLGWATHTHTHQHACTKHKHWCQLL